MCSLTIIYKGIILILMINKREKERVKRLKEEKNNNK
jgi:hypothetical protein